MFDHGPEPSAEAKKGVAKLMGVIWLLIGLVWLVTFCIDQAVGAYWSNELCGWTGSAFFVIGLFAVTALLSLILHPWQEARERRRYEILKRKYDNK